MNLPPHANYKDAKKKADDNPSYFYRIEFQARGAPHVHLLVWLKDKNGISAPSLLDSTEENIQQKMHDVAEYHDKIIQCQIDEDEEQTMKDNIQRFQHHTCGFTCHKRKKTITIKAKEGHALGETDQSRMLELPHVPICRFSFPRPPIDETTVLLGFSKEEDEDLIKYAKQDYLAIRKYLIRQTYVPDKAKLEDQPNYQILKKMDFKTFLQKIGMYSKVSSQLSEAEKFEQAKARYHTALRAGIKGFASVFPQRNLQSLFINNFNKKIMEIQPANHDIQYCMDPYSTAQYIVGYLTKNEAGMSALLKKVDEECSNLSEIKKINKLASVLDKHREVSIQECVYRLLGLPMSKFSTVVKYLNTNHPKHRDGLLRSDLSNLDKDDSAFYPSPHQYYEERPSWDNDVYLDNMCLADWWSLYDHSLKKRTKKSIPMHTEKHGWMTKRTERAVLRYYLPFEDEVEMARGLCILFLPFRNEMIDIHNKDPIKLLAKNHEIINNNRMKFEKNNMINEMIKRIEHENANAEESDDETEDCREEETTEKYQILEQQEAYDKQKACEVLPKDDTNLNYLDPVELRKYITSLNSQQRQIFDDIMERVTAGDLEDNPFHCYIAGEAGTGKSHLLKLLIYAIRQLKAKSGQDLDKPSVIVMAPTANAAFLIKGKTIESAMHINMERYNTFSKTSAARSSELAFEYQDVVTVICDEISMVGTNKLAAINYRMQELAEGPKKKEFMGGKSFICAGDLRQLPPVHDQYIFEKSKLDGRPSVAPCHWNENFKIYYLTEKMRCPDDIQFAELCDRVGTGSITDDDEAFLRSKIVTETIPSEEDNSNFTSGKVAIIVTTNEKRDEINLNKLRRLLHHKQEFVCLADDQITNRKHHIPLPDTVSYSKSHGMMKNLIIREGAPVMITTNHKTARYKEDGIVNGAKGYIDYIQRSEENPDIVEAIWVVFQHEDVGAKCYRREKRHLRPKGSEHYLHENALPILPTRKPFNVQQDNMHYIRKQFPLTLAYAMTAHKCQGSTLEEVIVDFTTNQKNKVFIDKGSFYVAITRVKSGNKLYLRSFEKSHIKVDPRIEYVINTMKFARPYQMKKVYMNESIFQEGEELKVGYLNINNLLDGYHADYLNGDHNLNSLDILAISETHLTSNVSTEELENVLSNFDIKARYDSPDNNHHMGLLVIAPKKSKLAKEYQQGTSHYLNKSGQTQIQTTSGSVRGKSFSFVYCRSTPTLSEVEWLQAKTVDANYLLGDLNLDSNITTQREKISIICSKYKTLLLNEITTKNNNQLDHILGIQQDKVFTTSFMNFVSDHKSIIIRISLCGASFLEDVRLPMTYTREERSDSS